MRMEGHDEGSDAETVKSLLLSGRGGRKVRLDEVARVIPEESSDLMLREGGRRKALISLNPSEGVDTGELVRKLHERLDPIVTADGCSLALGGSSQARESAGRRLAVLSVVLIAAIFLVLTSLKALYSPQRSKIHSSALLLLSMPRLNRRYSLTMALIY